MATSTTSRARKRQTQGESGSPLITQQRKKEILGLILMALSILLSLALFTHNPVDDAVTRSISLKNALLPDGNSARNALGLVGALIARILIPNFLGYNVLLLTFLLLGWGYVIFRDRRPVYLPLLTILGLASTIIFASIFGWLGVALDDDFGNWSGAWGAGIAGWMDRVFGTIGSFILLVLMLTIIGLLFHDHDIQRSVDRIEELFLRLRDRFREWRMDFRTRISNRRSEQSQTIREQQERRQSVRDQSRENVRDQLTTQRRSPAENVRDSEFSPIRTGKPSPNNPSSNTINDLFRQDNGQKEPPPHRTSPTVESHSSDESVPQIELKVRQRIEEEKADFIQRTNKTADEIVPYRFPPVDLLDEPDSNAPRIDYKELEDNKQVLLDKLATYNIEITDINAIVGPTVTLYELTPAPGVKISRITALEDDLAMAMAARGIRMIAPIPGKTAIGVEIPNRHRELVRIRDVIGTAKFRDARMELPVTIGKTIEGEVFLEDLIKMPHLLIAGATGSGKSVGLNALITGLLYACHPLNLKFVMIDPKKIELQQYAQIVDHYIAMPPDADDPIITDFLQALGVLKSCEKEMERRYDLLSKATVRGIKDYNLKFKQGKLSTEEGHRHLPYIVVVVDELADLMMTAGKDIEGPIARLAQMARAVGIHLVLATQRPSVDVITGLIKANFPSRIAYQVASKVDSRTILDQNGAEGLVGNGDLLYMLGSRIIRLQGPFVSVDEVEEITRYITEQPGPGPYILPSFEEIIESMRSDPDMPEEMDDLFKEAARIIVRSQQGSVSLLQRKLSVGYARAARIVDQLEDAGIVGPFEGSKARQVLVEDEMQLEEIFRAREE